MVSAGGHEFIGGVGGYEIRDVLLCITYSSR